MYWVIFGPLSSLMTLMNDMGERTELSVEEGKNGNGIHVKKSQALSIFYHSLQEQKLICRVFYVWDKERYL